MAKHCFDPKCRELAEYFFGTKDPRLDEIAQEIQDAVESFPVEWDHVAKDCRRAAPCQTMEQK